MMKNESRCFGRFSSKFLLTSGQPQIIIKRIDNFEENPDQILVKLFFFCNWNINSILAHNFMKLLLLHVYISVKNFDIVFSRKLTQTHN